MEFRVFTHFDITDLVALCEPRCCNIHIKRIRSGFLQPSEEPVCLSGPPHSFFIDSILLLNLNYEVKIVYV